MENFDVLKELFDNSSTYYLITVNMESRYSYVNQHYKKLFESQHGNLEGQHFAITMHPDDISICGQVAAQCFAAPDQMFPATIRKHDGKGGYIATQWDYKAMFDHTGQPTGMVCIGYDITSFIEKTAALDQMNYIQSHIIRKPIANLIGLFKLLQESHTETDQKRILELLNSSITELDTITKSY